MNWGFGGVTLDYNGGQANVNAVVPGHPIYLGPFVPITTIFSGNNFSHARIVGGGTTSLLEGFGDVVLSSKPWGSGLVMFGGMTTPFITYLKSKHKTLEEIYCLMLQVLPLVLLILMYGSLLVKLLNL